MIRVHELKCWTEYFQPIWDGDKTFDVRINDRNFKVGDVIVLGEFCNETQLYLKRSVTAYITYILKSFPHIDEGYVVLAFKVMRKEGGT
jgi:ASC-1-like (ASCH) protein